MGQVDGPTVGQAVVAEYESRARIAELEADVVRYRALIAVYERNLALYGGYYADWLFPFREQADQ